MDMRRPSKDDVYAGMREIVKNNDDVMGALAMLGRDYMGTRDTSLIAAVRELTKKKGVAITLDAIFIVLEQHKIEITAEIVCKAIECASYKEWQDIKAEAWGKK